MPEQTPAPPGFKHIAAFRPFHAPPPLELGNLSFIIPAEGQLCWLAKIGRGHDLSNIYNIRDTQLFMAFLQDRGPTSPPYIVGVSAVRHAAEGGLEFYHANRPAIVLASMNAAQFDQLITWLRTP